MKKIFLILLILTVISLSFYYYYQAKVKEVIILGQVVGFEINNFDVKEEKSNTSNIVLTSLAAVGTITCVDKETNSFVALGHSISNEKNINSLEGECYKINFEYVKKGQMKTEGKIIAQINKDEKIGTLKKGNEYGIYGKYDIDQISESKLIKTANRFDVIKGKAFIYLDIDGTGIKEYEVYVTNINYLNKNQNIRIKVESEELIKLAGGIARGMSGAPVVQNGKIVGAINCVNPENPLDAYAIFIDKLVGGE